MSAPRHIAQPQAVMFDLFGTLVDAPTPAQRFQASQAVGVVAAVPAAVVEQVFTDSWAERHDGRLPTLNSLSTYLWERCGRDAPAPQDVCTILLQLATGRLSVSPAVIAVLRMLRERGIQTAVLSDAPADIAEAWPRCELSEFVDAAVFSCRAGVVKPHLSLYRMASEQLGAMAENTVYCGDGGGDELRGAAAAGMTAVRVERRGGPSSMAFGDAPWRGPTISDVEQLPTWLWNR